MRYRFSNPFNPGRALHSYRMLQLLEVKKLPVAGMPARMLPGISSDGKPVEIMVWVIALVGEAKRSPSGYAHKRSTHRVFCQCPGCGKGLSAGRLFQHRCPVKPATGIEKRVAELVAAGWSADTVLIPEQCAAMYDPDGKAWHVEVDGQSPMPEPPDAPDADENCTGSYP